MRPELKSSAAKGKYGCSDVKVSGVDPGDRNSRDGNRISIYLEHNRVINPEVSFTVDSISSRFNVLN
jgi:hypothetical protein